LERFIGNCTLNQCDDYSVMDLDQLWRIAAKIDPIIGLNLYGMFTPQDIHAIVYLCSYCPDVASSMEHWARFAKLASDTDSGRLIRDKEGAGVELTVDAPPVLARYLTEHYGVMSITQLRCNTGQLITPVLVQFSHSRPSYYRYYTQWFGERIEYNCEKTRLYYDPSCLTLPLITRHSGMLDLLTSELDRRIATYQRFSSWGAKVAGCTRQALSRGVAPSLEDIAEALFQSSRTLRRRLDEEGTTFRELVDQVRSETELYLELNGASRTEISTQLGYSDLAAYLHARKRWAIK
jgi:AraC-like DNA-binding protein